MIASPRTTVMAYLANAINISGFDISVIKEAINANTAIGAINMIRSTILRTTSLSPSKNALTGLDSSGLMSNRLMPKKMTKKITCNILPLLEAALKKLSGTISTKNCNGPLSAAAPAELIFALAFSS